MKTGTCGVCGAPFERGPRAVHQRWCGPTCRLAAHAGVAGVVVDLRKALAENAILRKAIDDQDAEIEALRLASVAERPKPVEVAASVVRFEPLMSPMARKLCPVHAEDPTDLRAGIACMLCNP